MRLWSLGTNPPSMFRDEAEKGYTAWILARTGGYLYFDLTPGQNAIRFQKWPLFINVLGVYTSATYQYAAMPFVGLFGLNEFTSRLPAALAGILTVLLVFFLIRKGTKDDRIALFAAFFLAVSPWHVLFSRWALQGIFLPLLVTLGLLFFLKGIEKKPVHLLLSGVFFGLAFYTYAVGRLFVPLLLICLVVIYRRRLFEEKKAAIGGAVLFLLISVPTFLYYVTGDRAARFSRLSIFADAGFLQAMARFFLNYLKHYDPMFLFVYGDEEIRHSLLGMGMMYLFEAPLLLYGLVLLVKKRTPFHLVLLAWFFIFPIPAAMTREGIPHALRSIVGLPMIPAICAVAAGDLLGKLAGLIAREKGARSRAIALLLFLVAMVIALNVFRMGRNLFLDYPGDSSFNWQYGVKQALAVLHDEDVSPERVYISGYITYAPYLVMFYEKTDPGKLREAGLEGLGYRFLPPGRGLNQFWENAPPGSWFILQPWELPGRTPFRKIPEPHPVKKGMPPPKTALKILRKNG